MSGCTATYSCIQNSPGGGTNIAADPRFVDDPNDPNNYHLSPDSPCIDTGDPNFRDSNETDIDGEPRIINNRVDMGADEFNWSKADFNGDGIVNFLDYAVLAAAWLTASGDGSYNEDCDLEDNNTIDYNDLALFCKDWLWQPAWEQSDLFTFNMFRMMSSDTSQGSGLAEALHAAAPPEQPQTALEPQLQPEVQSESEPQPQDELSPDTQVLIDWLEGVLADEQNREMIDEEGIRQMIELLKEQQ